MKFECRSPYMNALLYNGNLFFTAVFAFESFAKLFAMGPRYFFAVKKINDICRNNLFWILFFIRIKPMILILWLSSCPLLSCWRMVSRVWECWDHSDYSECSNLPSLGSPSMIFSLSWSLLWPPSQISLLSWLSSSSYLLSWECSCLENLMKRKSACGKDALVQDGISKIFSTVLWSCSECCVENG